ncbi:MAG: lysophospholipid acyltransferase family protein [Pseudomonadota bacterium]
MRYDDIPWEACSPPEPDAPPLSALLGAQDVRRQAMRYHVHDRLLGSAKYAFNAVSRALPPAAGSGFGAHVLAPLAERANRKRPYYQRLLTNAERLRPDLVATEADRRAFISRWYENTARAMSEFARVEALVEPPYTTTFGTEIARRTEATGRSTIMVSVHTGMWEMASRIGAIYWFNKGTGAWQPQKNRFDNRIVAATRRRMKIKALPAGPQLGRQLFKVLAEGGQSLVMIIDEVADGGTLFPFFGREPPDRSNFAFVLRLAQRTNAYVLPLIITRTAPVRFSYGFAEPLEVAPGRDGVREAALALNAIYEPHVIANLDQWYMLHALRLPQG